MFSRFLKYIIPPFSFRVFFRRIFYSNLKKVPLEKPLLFVGNHQNSFMDGILVGSYLPQPLHFLMRADMFRKPFARFCLRELNVAPFTGLKKVLKMFIRILKLSQGFTISLKITEIWLSFLKVSVSRKNGFRNSERVLPEWHSGLKKNMILMFILSLSE